MPAEGGGNMALTVHVNRGGERLSTAKIPLSRRQKSFVIEINLPQDGTLPAPTLVVRPHDAAENTPAHTEDAPKEQGT
jgi:hypothetical protein